MLLLYNCKVFQSALNSFLGDNENCSSQVNACTRFTEVHWLKKIFPSWCSQNSTSLLDLSSNRFRLKKRFWHAFGFFFFLFLFGIEQSSGSRGERCWACSPSLWAFALQSPTVSQVWWNQLLCPRKGLVWIPTQRQGELKIDFVPGVARPGRFSKALYQPSAVAFAESAAL